MHKGRIKIWTGMGLLASGLFVMPLTAVGHNLRLFRLFIDLSATADSGCYPCQRDDLALLALTDRRRLDVLSCAHFSRNPS